MRGVLSRVVFKIFHHVVFVAVVVSSKDWIFSTLKEGGFKKP